MRYLSCKQCGGSQYGPAIRAYPDMPETDVVECTACGLMQAQPVPQHRTTPHLDTRRGVREVQMRRRDGFEVRGVREELKGVIERGRHPLVSFENVRTCLRV